MRLKDCEGCKRRREAMLRMLQGMASTFMHPNATTPQPQPTDSVKPPPESESESSK